MNENLTVLTSLVGSGLLTAALVFLAKNWISERLKNAIKSEYDLKLENHRADLKRESDREIERLKSELKRDSDREIEHLKGQLQIIAAERNIRLTRVFDETAKQIATIYAKLWELKEAADDFTILISARNDPNKDTLLGIFNKTLGDVVRYVRLNQIYLPQATNQKLWEYVWALQSAVRSYEMLLTAESHGVRSEVRDKLGERFQKASEKPPELFELLHDEFQKNLGFPIEERPAYQTSTTPPTK